MPSLLTSIRAHDDFDSDSVFDHVRKMEHQAPNPPAQPQLTTHTPALPQNPSLTASSTPVSSPGLFSPSNPRTTMSLPPSQSVSEGTTPAALNSPFLHPLQNHRVREYVFCLPSQTTPATSSLLATRGGQRRATRNPPGRRGLGDRAKGCPDGANHASVEGSSPSNRMRNDLLTRNTVGHTSPILTETSPPAARSSIITRSSRRLAAVFMAR